MSEAAGRGGHHRTGLVAARTARRPAHHAGAGAAHVGRSLSDGARSFWGGFVLQHGGETIYYSGDSAYGPHFAEIGRRFPDLGIAFVENGQYDRRWPDNHMFPEQTAQAAADVKPRRVMPVHWGHHRDRPTGRTRHEPGANGCSLVRIALAPIRRCRPTSERRDASTPADPTPG
ncbi:MAG: hypothetical protein E6Q64_01605 [Ottowia sp.]|nr:MAG: hypothetical protein E6Q64_01605 [Ottowia sp.]